MTFILRLFAWLLAAAITFATLGPARFRPHSYLGQDGEHALAFVLLGLAFGLAYTRNRLLAAAIAVAGSGGIEILQLWAPGRHARLEDFVVDALAACAGLAVAAGADWVMQRRRRSNADAS
jgi:VanZ family protein